MQLPDGHFHRPVMRSVVEWKFVRLSLRNTNLAIFGSFHFMPLLKGAPNCCTKEQ